MVCLDSLSKTTHLLYFNSLEIEKISLKIGKLEQPLIALPGLA